MSDSLRAETQLWQARCDDQTVAIERLREERDELRTVVNSLTVVNQSLLKELDIYKSMVDRMRIAMSQGTEL